MVVYYSSLAKKFKYTTIIVNALNVSIENTKKYQLIVL